MELETIKNEARPIADQTKNIEIKNADDLSNAVGLLSVLNKNLDMVTAYEEKKTKNWKAKIKAITDQTGPVKRTLKSRVEYVRNCIGAYQTMAERKALTEETKIADKMLTGKLKPETATKKLATIEKPESKIETANGSVTFATLQRLKITDRESVPMDFWEINEKKLLDALKGGMQIPGAELEDYKSVRNSR